MRVIIQRVKKASVTVSDHVIGEIRKGFMILLGIEKEDTSEDVMWLVNKVTSLRIFSDSEEKMNLDIKDVAGEILVISQFTLHAKYKKGNRPSFIHAARPEQAIPLYKEFITELGKIIELPIQTGEFGAMMDVSLVNDGPVSIIMDTKNKE